MIGFVAGAFDLLHPGHLFFLKEAKTRCDYLMVGLHIDPSLENKNKNKPVESVFERIVRLEACKYVDKIIPYSTEQELEIILLNFRIDRRFLGSDYIEEKKKITGESFVPITYLGRKHPYSSTKLRKRLK